MFGFFSSDILDDFLRRKPGIFLDHNNIFIHGSEYYVINTNVILANTGKSIPIDANNVVEFRWENTINSLYITGTIIIRDSDGSLGSIDHSLFTHVTVSLSKLKPNIENGKIINFDYDDLNKFSHSFFVNNVEILDRSKNEVDYALYLVSDMYFATKRMLYWSNFDKITQTGQRPEKDFNPFKILKQLFEMAYSEMDEKFSASCEKPGFFEDGFEKAASKCKLLMDYSTNTETTIQDAIDYILNRTFYTWDEKNDVSLKLFAYDTFYKKIKLIDFKDAMSFVETNWHSLLISLYGSPLEELLVPINQSFSSLNQISNIDFYDTFIKNTWIGWNEGMGTFTGGNRKDNASTVTTERISKYIEPGLNIIPSKNIFKMKLGTNEREIFDTIFNTKIPGHADDVVFNKIYTTWNNTNSIYLDLIYNTIYKNAVIFNTNGKIRHNPGTLIGITSEDNKKLNDNVQTKDPYDGILGLFFVVKTEHIVHPSKSSAEKFTENLILSKWWEPKT